MSKNKLISLNKDVIFNQDYIVSSDGYIYNISRQTLYKIKAQIPQSYIVEDISEILSTDEREEILINLLKSSAYRIQCMNELTEHRKKIAEHDALTGIPNRVPLESDFKRISDACNAYMVMLDIDHFKQINDTYGHGNGDIILKTVAQAITSAIGYNEQSSNIFAYRWGGEEFVVLLNGYTIEDVIKIVRKIQDNIKCETQKVIRLFNSDKDLKTNIKYRTASIGFVKINDNFEQTLERADAAMYYAKSDCGRANIQYNFINDKDDNNYLVYICKLLNEGNSPEFNESGVVSLEKKNEKSK